VVNHMKRRRIREIALASQTRFALWAGGLKAAPHALTRVDSANVFPAVYGRQAVWRGLQPALSPSRSPRSA